MINDIINIYYINRQIIWRRIHNKMKNSMELKAEKWELWHRIITKAQLLTGKPITKKENPYSTKIKKRQI